MLNKEAFLQALHLLTIMDGQTATNFPNTFQYKDSLEYVVWVICEKWPRDVGGSQVQLYTYPQSRVHAAKVRRGFEPIAHTTSLPPEDTGNHIKYS